MGLRWIFYERVFACYLSEEGHKQVEVIDRDQAPECSYEESNDRVTYPMTLVVDTAKHH